MTTSHRPYDRPPAQMTPDGFCEIRASAVGDCQRRLFYSAGNVPKTDAVPEPAQRVMDYGNLLERQVLRMLEDCGWLLGNDGKPSGAGSSRQRSGDYRRPCGCRRPQLGLQ